MLKEKFSTALALIAIVIAIASSFRTINVQVQLPSEKLGAGTRFENGLSTDSTSPSAGQVRTSTLNVSGASTFGSSGTAVSQILTGTCTLTSNSSITASSTGTGTCAISNLAHGDKVFLQLATTSANTVLRNVIITASSVTAGAASVTANLYNQTGADVVPASLLSWGSSTQYMILR